MLNSQENTAESTLGAQKTEKVNKDNSQFNTNWIWVPDWNHADDYVPNFLYFRKEVDIEKVPERFDIQISADSRYKLYINGVFLQEGPGKGDLQTWYYDEAELVPYFTNGKNVIAVEVLRYPDDITKRNHSLLRTGNPCLYVADGKKEAEKEDDLKMTLAGKSGWKCRRIESIHLVPEPSRPAPLHILEEAKGEEKLNGWKRAGYDDTDWLEAKPYTFFQMNQAESPWNLKPRDIPYQKHLDCRFQELICIREWESAGAKVQDTTEMGQSWGRILAGEGDVMISPNTKQIVEISAGELMTGYLLLACIGGKGARITIHCAESYAYPSDRKLDKTNCPLKGDRIDHEKGRLYGYKDTYTVAGYGKDKHSENYEPYWFRTFRFVELTIETMEEALTLKDFSYRQTGYPLEVRTKVITSDPTLSAIWDISERTLRRCMHETYMDCPFYEQLSYAMDSRSQILFTYAVSADDRLARKCMEDFRRSQRYDGMINCSAPNARANVIPGFSVYYILMVHDHMMYFGDKELVRRHLPAIDEILQFFEAHVGKKGLVENVGGAYMRHPYWSFIDWAPEWNRTAGVPTAVFRGSITMESLLYIMGLQHAAELAEYLGRNCVAEEYRMQAERVRQAVCNHCMGITVADGGHQNLGVSLIQDGPSVDEYSVHCQVFGILTGTVRPEEGKRMLEETIDNKAYAQCSVAMSFYLFRALEKVKWYKKTKDIWMLWNNMVRQHLTTCVENDTDARSDCHAWGAVILYELPAVTLGVRPAAPGFEKIRIAPDIGYFEESAGDVITPKGLVHVEWKKTVDGECEVTYVVPEGLVVVDKS